MSDRVKVRATRAMLYRGECVPPGAILTLTAADAMNALDSGRAELLDPADRAAVLAGRRAEVQAQMRQHGRLMPPPADGPWFPIQ